MTIKRAFRPTRSTTAIAASLSLAPHVVAMRLPLLFLEAFDAGSARNETNRATEEKAVAAVEGIVAAQTIMAQSAAFFWWELMSGRTPSLLSGAAFRRAADAAMRPSGKQVRANYKRLSRP